LRLGENGRAAHEVREADEEEADAPVIEVSSEADGDDFEEAVQAEQRAEEER
jgi:hypothetical protein